MHAPPPATWTFDPVVILGLLALLGAYLAAIGPLRRRYHPERQAPTGRALCYLFGWLVLALSLLSPLDTLGRYYLFTAHTLQLFLMITVIAPLLMQGLPEWLVASMLPTRALRNATRGLLFPVLATIVFNAIILVWHVGPLYQLALRSTLAHNLQSLSFLVAGVLTWWPLLTPLDRHTRMSSPFQILYLLLESLPLDVFGAAVIFTPRIFYPTYAAAARVFPLTALADQQVSGAILAVPGNIIDIGLMSVIFFAWIHGVERAQRERERHEFADDATPDGTAPQSAGTQTAHAEATSSAES